ncbi:FHIPEP family type III secretion protein, partial [Siminovitchia fortis]|uniref:FHIPEP family type III secretion protein n=1 Tax=Siminovitchia fortis TaxID=254758 RepID=UPI00119F1DC1
EVGVVISVVRMRDNIQLETNEYLMKIKGEEVARGTVVLDDYLAMRGGGEDRIQGIDRIEGSFGVGGKWIWEEVK